MIPIGGVLRRTHAKNVLLIGDAAGLCGAFAADGIKGAIVSGKEAASLITRTLSGDTAALAELPARVNAHDGLMDYYRRQVRYRFIWDRMRRNRTFAAMHAVIAAERDSFLDQFCDSKDRRHSLARVVLKPRHALRLARYASCLLLDVLGV